MIPKPRYRVKARREAKIVPMPATTPWVRQILDDIREEMDDPGGVTAVGVVCVARDGTVCTLLRWSEGARPRAMMGGCTVLLRRIQDQME